MCGEEGEKCGNKPPRSQITAEFSCRQANTGSTSPSAGSGADGLPRSHRGTPAVLFLLTFPHLQDFLQESPGEVLLLPVPAALWAGLPPPQ